MDARRIGADLVTLYEVGTTGALDDAELVRRFVDGHGDRGSQVAFEAIVERHGGLVRGICQRILRDSHAADDAAQSVFLVLSRKAGAIRCDGSLAPWLYGVSVRVARRARVVSQSQPFGLPRGLDPCDRAPEPGGAEQTEVIAALDAEIARLPVRFRAAVILCHIEGLDHREAARRLRCPLGTLESRLHRSRERLRRGLTRRGLAPAGLVAALSAAGHSARAATPAFFSATVGLAVGGQGAGAAGFRPLARGLMAKFMGMRAAVFAGLVTLIGIGGGAGLIGGSGSGESAVQRELPQAEAGQPQSRPVAAAPAVPSVSGQIRAVMAEWARFQATNGRARMVATSSESSGRLIKEFEAKFVDCSGRLLKLIESAPSDPACLEAMFWHVEYYWISGTHGTLKDQLVRSVDVLLHHYSDEPRIAWRVAVKRNGMPTGLDDRLLPGLVAAARRRELKGLALMALGRYLEDKACFVIQAKRSDGPFRIDWPGSSSTTRVYDEAYERVLRSCDAAALDRETETVLARIVAECADVVQEGRDPGDPDYPLQTVRRVIGKEAADRLAAHRSITIGQAAPELSWTTQDGRTSKLSDFRGKVVVLAFWRGWDHWPSQSDFEHEFQVVRELKGRPFVLIGFSHKDPGEQGFSLPFARPDGSEAVPADGPILERLGVRSFPTTIVIDADGVVCMRCVDGRYLGEYIRGLVKDAEGRSEVK